MADDVAVRGYLYEAMLTRRLQLGSRRKSVSVGLISFATNTLTTFTTASTAGENDVKVKHRSPSSSDTITTWSIRTMKKDLVMGSIMSMTTTTLTSRGILLPTRVMLVITEVINVKDRIARGVCRRLLNVRTNVLEMALP